MDKNTVSDIYEMELNFPTGKLIVTNGLFLFNRDVFDMFEGNVDSIQDRINVSTERAELGVACICHYNYSVSLFNANEASILAVDWDDRNKYLSKGKLGEIASILIADRETVVDRMRKLGKITFDDETLEKELQYLEYLPLDVEPGTHYIYFSPKHFNDENHLNHMQSNAIPDVEKMALIPSIIISKDKLEFGNDKTVDCINRPVSISTIKP